MSELNQLLLFMQLIALPYEKRTKHTECEVFVVYKLGDAIVTAGLDRVEGNEILICGLYGSMQGRIQACGRP